MLDYKIKLKDAQLNEWCEQNNLRRDYSRELVQEQLPLKNVAKTKNSGIIKKKNYLQKQLPYIHNGEKLFIPNNTIIKNTHSIAGRGTKKELKISSSLAKKYGGNASDWIKNVGKVESDKYIFDVHWYELNGKQYRMKLKNRSEKK